MQDAISAIISEIKKLDKEQCVVAIDGRCAAGKTTLAASLHSALGCSIIHMDDFFLQPYQRCEARLNEIGGNIDYERFLNEVILPLKSKKKFSYRAFDCHTMGFGETVNVRQTDVIVVEGSYSCHPKFADIYDLKIFMDIGKKEQINRIEKRNGSEQLSQFIHKWIPLEEKYFDFYKIKNNSDLIIEIK
ncbi:MAG: hypothetical protein K2L19_00070 [Eubacterium sp.]|nr:hypothetical protein [Eubacterium sp.]